ncbi:hypothetical protein FNH05_00310 [Amycolatopsis rhizosphaerae]|uniref:PE domain-containing protein n=1 Tax=Amycolatopsis rhizosphaerae TaxID=2053003 RepID=A0A558DPG5_9PSEU|nr:hypothetical protein [Amycolatopsis rhizosphaerae]TVT62858.1 hypothetical protein FNH05_00310 [Amycolatopsis rhizosphaerae]
MAGEGSSQIQGVLDGHVDPSTVAPPSAAEQAIDTQIAIDRLNAEIQTQSVGLAPTGAQQVATATPGSGGYHFSPEKIADLITEWEKLRDVLRDDERNLKDAALKAWPPSPDHPATRNAEATRKSIVAAIDQNQAMQQYCQAYVYALRKANGTYVQQDEDTGKGLNSGAPKTDGSAL